MHFTQACRLVVLRTGLLACCGLPAIVLAEAPDSLATETQISVNSPRHPGVMPYRKAYELLDKLQSAGKGQVDVIVRVTPEDRATPQSQVKVWLVGPHIDQPVPISADGTIQVPLIREAYDENAELVSNQKKGALQVEIKMQPRFNEQPIRYQHVQDMIKLARNARNELLPWYLRLLLPNIASIDFCSPASDGTVIVTAADRISQRAADHLEKTNAASLHCARIGRNEAGLAPDAVLTPAAGMVAQFGG